MKGNGKPARWIPHRIQITPTGEVIRGEVIACDELRGFSKVEFTVHALDQMKIRGLTRDEVVKTIREPEKTGLPTQSGRHRHRRYRSEKRAVDVIFEDGDDRVVVVTAMIVTLRTKDRPD